MLSFIADWGIVVVAHFEVSCVLGMYTQTRGELAKWWFGTGVFLTKKLNGWAQTFLDENFVNAAYGHLA